MLYARARRNLEMRWITKTNNVHKLQFSFLHLRPERSEPLPFVKKLSKRSIILKYSFLHEVFSGWESDKKDDTLKIWPLFSVTSVQKISQMSALKQNVSTWSISLRGFSLWIQWMVGFFLIWTPDWPEVMHSRSWEKAKKGLQQKHSFLLNELILK